MVTKKELREQYLMLRSQMTEVEVRNKSRRIYEKLVASLVYKEAEWVFTYVNMGKEIETIPIIKQAIYEKKRVAVPKVLPKEKRMVFLEIYNLTDLKTGHFGVLEPLYQRDREINDHEQGIFLIPGLVFDQNRYRIGYGGGYYDKYLAAAPSAIKIGVAYGFQVVENIPKEQFDIPVDCIITEEGWEK